VPLYFCGWLDDQNRWSVLDCIWNVMAHTQKPDFVFRQNGRVRLNRLGRRFIRLLAAEVCTSAFMVGSNAWYTMFRGGVKGTGSLLLATSPVSPSLPLPCVTVCHHISTGLYKCDLVGFLVGFLWICCWCVWNIVVIGPVMVWYWISGQVTSSQHFRYRTLLWTWQDVDILVFCVVVWE